MLRFPRLYERIMDVVTAMLKMRLPPTNSMVENLVGIELSYINTKHPDFHDAAALVGSLLRETQGRLDQQQNFVQPNPGGRHERHLAASESAISSSDSQESRTGVSVNGYVQQEPRSPFSSKPVNLLPEVVIYPDFCLEFHVEIYTKPLCSLINRLLI